MSQLRSHPISREVSPSFAISMVPPVRCGDAISPSAAAAFPLIMRNLRWYSTVRTAKREDTYKWVGPVVSDDWALFAPSDSKIVLKSLEDARKYKLGGYQGDAAGDFLVTHKFNVDIADTDKLNPRKLIAGRIDLWIAGVRTGPFVAHREGVMNIKPIFTFGEAKDYQMYLACNKAVPDDTIKRLNDILKQMHTDGSTAKIQATY